MRRHPALRRASFLVVGLLSLLTACGPSIIQGSPVISPRASIPDTEDHRALIEVVETYRRALEDKDVASLRRIISNDYYENAGTNHTTVDDYGYDGLTYVFELMSQNVRQLRLSIQVRHIEVQGNRANIYLDYAFNMLFVVEGQERWHVGQDLNRLELVREADNQWRVIAGL